MGAHLDGWIVVEPVHLGGQCHENRNVRIDHSDGIAPLRWTRNDPEDRSFSFWMLRPTSKQRVCTPHPDVIRPVDFRRLARRASSEPAALHLLTRRSGPAHVSTGPLPAWTTEEGVQE